MQKYHKNLGDRYQSPRQGGEGTPDLRLPSINGAGNTNRNHVSQLAVTSSINKKSHRASIMNNALISPPRATSNLETKANYNSILERFHRRNSPTIDAGSNEFHSHQGSTISVKPSYFFIKSGRGSGIIQSKGHA